MFDIGAYRETIYLQQPYREPERHEVDSFIEVFDKVLRGEYDFSPLAPLGYMGKVMEDPTSRKQYALITPSEQAPAEQAWGTYLIDTSKPIRYAITAPHPRSDIKSEVIAFKLWQQTDGVLLMLAGAQRRSADGLANVTRQSNSLFHQLSMMLAAQGIPQVQLHGFADASAPQHDVIVSSGATSPTAAIERTATYMKAAGLRVATNLEKDGVKGLFGRLNIQGKAAKQYGTPFMHVEMSFSTRMSEEAVQKVIDAIGKELN